MAKRAPHAADGLRVTACLYYGTSFPLSTRRSAVQGSSLDFLLAWIVRIE